MAHFWIACHACGKQDKVKACTRCRRAYYCNADCQKQCWEKGFHSMFCQPLQERDHNPNPLPIGAINIEGKEEANDPVGRLSKLIFGRYRESHCTYEQLFNYYYDATTYFEDLNWELFSETPPNERKSEEEITSQVKTRILKDEDEHGSNVKLGVNVLRALTDESWPAVAFFSSLFKMVAFNLSYERTLFASLSTILKNGIPQQGYNIFGRDDYAQQRKYKEVADQIKHRQRILVDYTNSQEQMAKELIQEYCDSHDLVFDGIIPNPNLLTSLMQRRWAQFIYDALPDYFKKKFIKPEDQSSTDDMDVDPPSDSTLSEEQTGKKRKRQDDDAMQNTKRMRHLSPIEVQERERLVIEMIEGRKSLKEQDTSEIDLPIEILMTILSPENEITFLDLQSLRQANIYIWRTDQEAANKMARFYFHERLWFLMCQRDFVIPLAELSKQKSHESSNIIQSLWRRVNGNYFGDVFYTFYLDQMKKTTKTIMQSCEKIMFNPLKTTIYEDTFQNHKHKVESSLDIQQLASDKYLHYTVHKVHDFHHPSIFFALWGNVDPSILYSQVEDSASVPLEPENTQNTTHLVFDKDVHFHFHDRTGQRHHSLYLGGSTNIKQMDEFYRVHILYLPYSFYVQDHVPDSGGKFPLEYYTFFHYFYRRALAYCICRLVDASPAKQKQFLRDRFDLDSNLFFESFETNERIPGGILTLTKTRPRFTYNLCTRYEMEGHIMAWLMMLDMQGKMVYPALGNLAKNINIFHASFFHTPAFPKAFGSTLFYDDSFENHPFHLERYRPLLEEESELEKSDFAIEKALLDLQEYEGKDDSKIDRSSYQTLHERFFVYDAQINRTPVHEAFAEFDVDNILSNPTNLVQGNWQLDESRMNHSSHFLTWRKQFNESFIVSLKENEISHHNYALRVYRHVYQPIILGTILTYTIMQTNDDIKFRDSFYTSLSRLIGKMVAFYPDMQVMTATPPHLPFWDSDAALPLPFQYGKQAEFMKHMKDNIQSGASVFLTEAFLSPIFDRHSQKNFDQFPGYVDTLSRFRNEFIGFSQMPYIPNLQFYKISKCTGEFYFDYMPIQIFCQLSVLAGHDVLRPSEVKNYLYYLDQINNETVERIGLDKGVAIYLFERVPWNQFVNEEIDADSIRKSQDSFRNWKNPERAKSILKTFDRIVSLLYFIFHVKPQILERKPEYPLRFLDDYDRLFTYDPFVPWYKTKLLEYFFKSENQ